MSYISRLLELAVEDFLHLVPDELTVWSSSTHHQPFLPRHRSTFLFDSAQISFNILFVSAQISFNILFVVATEKNGNMFRMLKATDNSEIGRDLC